MMLLKTAKNSFNSTKNRRKTASTCKLWLVTTIPLLTQTEAEVGHCIIIIKSGMTWHLHLKIYSLELVGPESQNTRTVGRRAENERPWKRLSGNEVFDLADLIWTLVLRLYIEFLQREPKWQLRSMLSSKIWPGFGLSRANHPYTDHPFDKICTFSIFNFWDWSCPLFGRSRASPCLLEVVDRIKLEWW